MVWVSCVALPEGFRAIHAGYGDYGLCNRIQAMRYWLLFSPGRHCRPGRGFDKERSRYSDVLRLRPSRRLGLRIMVCSNLPHH